MQTMPYLSSIIDKTQVRFGEKMAFAIGKIIHQEFISKLPIVT